MSFFSSLILVALGSGIDNLVFGSNVILLFSLYTHHHTIIYITYFYMDAIQQTILIPSQPSFSTSSPHQLVHFTNSHKSSDVEKQALIAKIRHVHGKNAELEAKQQSLQNTLNDLRKLLQSTASENQQYIKQIEEENEKLGEKAARLAAGLRQAHRQGKHLDNCSLFWRAFVE